MLEGKSRARWWMAACFGSISLLAMLRPRPAAPWLGALLGLVTTACVLTYREVLERHEEHRRARGDHTDVDLS